MPIFVYKAKQKNAETVEGQVVAVDRQDAVDKISQMGLMPVTVQEGGARVTGEQPAVRSGRVKNKDLYLFTRQMVTMLKGGVSILQALEICSRQSKSAYLRTVVRDVSAGIREGRSFSDVLAGYPQIFSPLYVTMVKAGEESGQLKEVLQDMAEHLKRQGDLDSKVRMAMAYPLFMATCGVITVVYILTGVMPKISAMFQDLGQQLPVPTLIVMAASDFLKEGWKGLALVTLVLVWVFRQWDKQEATRIIKSKLKMSLPWAGDFLIKAEMVRFCRTFGLLIKSGIPVLRSLQLAIPTVNNEVLKQHFRQCQEELSAGRSFGESLKKVPSLPPIVGHLIAVGEESGSLDASLAEIADSLEQETDEVIKLLTTFLEPLMILVIGAVIGFIVVAMLLPIFELDVFAR